MSTTHMQDRKHAGTAEGVLGAAFLRRADQELAATDELLERCFPGDPGTRQPVHTVYVPADAFTPDLARTWGERALAAVADGGLQELATAVAPEGTSSQAQAAVVAAVEHKLRTEPIEDLRIDFEDGFGDQGDQAEDAQAVAAAQAVADAVRSGTAPPFIGIRFKCFEAATRERGLRTLDLFVSTLVRSGGLREAGVSPDGLPVGLVLTLPKVSTFAQVQVMVRACERLEQELGLAHGRLRFEVQMETAPLILGVDGRSPLGDVIHRTDGRVEALHYGTYDYSDSLQIAAEYQSMEHPAADHAKAIMQVAVAGTGVRLSDGSTNILPLGEPAQRDAAWANHARLVRRSLEHGYYQGWDLHPAQLPTRFLATYFFFAEGFPAAAVRLRNYVEKVESAVMDEPATARALARFVHRGLLCGAVPEDQLRSATGLDPQQLVALAHPRAAAGAASAPTTPAPGGSPA
ncbi:aldolase [Brachybacterium avium]|uniref:Aldolase n=1 Tax=Brachybacterium avium TaxID=2017485 RepID=A0A220UEW1_9MICO|nr:aldolase [Brachybacterium avium]ASK66446.1 aldolase [Brachybacterium avium]